MGIEGRSHTPEPIPVNLVGGGMDSNLTPGHHCYESAGRSNCRISQRDLVASLDQILFNRLFKTQLLFRDARWHSNKGKDATNGVH